MTRKEPKEDRGQRGHVDDPQALARTKERQTRERQSEPGPEDRDVAMEEHPIVNLEREQQGRARRVLETHPSRTRGCEVAHELRPRPLCLREPQVRSKVSAQQRIEGISIEDPVLQPERRREGEPQDHREERSQKAPRTRFARVVAKEEPQGAKR